MSVNRSTTLVDVPRGLAGVVVTDTEVGDVRGRRASITTASTRLSSSRRRAASRTSGISWSTANCRTPDGPWPSVPRPRHCGGCPTRCGRRCRRSRRRMGDPGHWPACAPRCRCSERRKGSVRSTTSTRTSGDGTPSWPLRPCRHCSPHCTGWARGWSRWSRVRISRTRRTTSTC